MLIVILIIDRNDAIEEMIFVFCFCSDFNGIDFRVYDPLGIHSYNSNSYNCERNQFNFNVGFDSFDRKC